MSAGRGSGGERARWGARGVLLLALLMMLLRSEPGAEGRAGGTERTRPAATATQPTARPAAAPYAPYAPAVPASSASRTKPARYASLRLLDLFTTYGGPVAPGGVPRGLSGVAPADCAGCHAQIAAEWQSSAHARAFTNAVFLAEYLPSAEQFCRNCHAPLVNDPAAAEAPSLLARGVDCATCHVRDGHVLGASGRGDADHQARRETRLRTSAFCGSCHQFDFPEPAPGKAVRYHPGQPLQNTLVEWQQSAYAQVSCQECHMPKVAPAGEAGVPASGETSERPHRSHAFRTFDDPALLAGAVRVSATARWRGEALEVTVALAPGKIGHAFPTGDMFRQGRLEVQLGKTTHTAVLERIFASTITKNARGHLLGQVDDTRVLPAKTAAAARHVLRFEGADVAAADGGRGEVRWSLVLYRLDPKVAKERGLPEELVRIPMTSGTLEVPAKPGAKAAAKSPGRPAR